MPELIRMVSNKENKPRRWISVGTASHQHKRADCRGRPHTISLRRLVSNPEECTSRHKTVGVSPIYVPHSTICWFVRSLQDTQPSRHSLSNLGRLQVLLSQGSGFKQHTVFITYSQFLLLPQSSNMFWSSLVLPLLAVPACMAAPSQEKRADITNTTLYAYGTNISGLPIVVDTATSTRFSPHPTFPRRG